jgi:hypothetical protein
MGESVRREGIEGRPPNVCLVRRLRGGRTVPSADSQSRFTPKAIAFRTKNTAHSEITQGAQAESIAVFPGKTLSVYIILTAHTYAFA